MSLRSVAPQPTALRDPTVAVVAIGLAVACALSGMAVATPGRTIHAVALAGVVGLCFAALALWVRFGLSTMVLIGFVGACLLAPMNGARPSDALTWADMLLVVAVGGLVAQLTIGRRTLDIPSEISRIAAGLGVVALAGTVGVVVSGGDAWASTNVAVRFAIAALGTVVVIGLWQPSARDGRIALHAWVLGATLNAITGLVITFAATGRSLGFSTHPNHLGLACLLAVPVALACALEAPRLATKVMWAVPAGLCTTVVLTSGSRAALLGTGVAVLAVCWLLGRYVLLLAAVTLLALGLLLTATGLLDVASETSLARLAGNEASREADLDRIDHLQLTFDRGAGAPFLGAGFEYALQGHNVYLQVWSSAGVVGLAGFAAAVAAVGTTLWRGAQRCQRSSPNRAVLVGVLGGGLGYLTSSMFQNMLWDRYLWLYFGIGVAIALRAAAASGAGSEPLAETGSTDAKPIAPR
jgi:hypothetical protein